MNILGNHIQITPGLINLLNDLYPNQLPSKDTSIEELRYLQGQQSVIRKLQELYEDAFEEN